MTRLDTLRALLAKATPGEWTTRRNTSTNCGVQAQRQHVYPRMASLYGAHDCLEDLATLRGASRVADADLIVALRNNADALLRLAEAAKAMHGALEQPVPDREPTEADVLRGAKLHDELGAALDALLAEEP